YRIWRRRCPARRVIINVRGRVAWHLRHGGERRGVGGLRRRRNRLVSPAWGRIHRHHRGSHCLVPGDCAGGYCNAGLCSACPPDMVEIPHPAGAFCIDATEVTNADYKAFATAPPSLIPSPPPFCDWNTDFEPAWGYLPDTMPVQAIDWCDAYTYCA